MVPIKGDFLMLIGVVRPFREYVTGLCGLVRL